MTNTTKTPTLMENPILAMNRIFTEAMPEGNATNHREELLETYLHANKKAYDGFMSMFPLSSAYPTVGTDNEEHETTEVPVEPAMEPEEPKGEATQQSSDYLERMKTLQAESSQHFNKLYGQSLDTLLPMRKQKVTITIEPFNK